MSEKKTVVVALSGGMDSATVLAHVVAKYGGTADITTVSFNYGSKHGMYEREAATKLAAFYGVRHWCSDLTAAMTPFKSHLLAGGGPIPEGHYEEESMKQTVVPARNIIFASVLAGIAWSLAPEEDRAEVYLGVHAGDHHIYADCRPQFINAMTEALKFGTDNKVALRAPYLWYTKQQILTEGMKIGVPYELTRTCYQAQSIACGRCGSCVERREAFEKCGAKDPLDYIDTGPLPEKSKTA